MDTPHLNTLRNFAEQISDDDNGIDSRVYQRNKASASKKFFKEQMKAEFGQDTTLVDLVERRNQTFGLNLSSENENKSLLKANSDLSDYNNFNGSGRGK